MGEKITKKVKAKQIKPPCNDTCRLKCKESFSKETRLQIFNKFRATGDKALQSQQISTLVTKNLKKPSKKRSKHTVRNREYTKAYTLLNGDSVSVCAKMFHNSLGINQKRVWTVMKNMAVTGAPVKERRG